MDLIFLYTLTFNHRLYKNNDRFGNFFEKSRKRLWWVSKSHFRVIVRLGVSKLETRVSQSRKVSNLPFFTPNSGVRVREREKIRRMRGRLERGLFLRSRPMPKPLAVFFWMLTSLCPAFLQSERLETITRRCFPRDFFTVNPNREPVQRLPGKRKWTLNRIWVVCYFSFKLIEWLASWPWEARASAVPPISRCWSRELAFARRKKRGRL